MEQLIINILATAKLSWFTIATIKSHPSLIKFSDCEIECEIERLGKAGKIEIQKGFGRLTTVIRFK